ncbi:MAG: histidine kinase dimerization/phospho-acceptor domain-containing protein [Pseudomonadota bacterium]
MGKNTEIKMPVNSTTACSSSAEDDTYKSKFHDLRDLTRSIFHELSQPITILLGYSEIMLSNMDTNDPLYKKLHEINKQADKADEIIRRMHNKIKYIEEDNTSGSKIIGKI